MDLLSRSSRLARSRSATNKLGRKSFEREQHLDYSSDSATSTSSPHSSVFSTPHHARNLSAASSFESSPTMDSSEFFNSSLPSSKRPGPAVLPDLAEDPAELDSNYAFPPSPVSPQVSAQFPRPSYEAPTPALPHTTSHFPRSSYDVPRSTHHAPPSRSLSQSQAQSQSRYSRRYEDYDSDDDGTYGKRRRSMEPHRTSFTDGMKSKIGSLTKRSRHLKRASTNSAWRPGNLTPSPSPSPMQQSRASSRSRRRPSFEISQPDYPADYAGLETIFSSENLDQRMTYLGYLQPHTETFEPTDEEPAPRSSTPLLPRFMEKTELVTEVQSPLQSPTVVPVSSGYVSHTIVSPVPSSAYISPLPSAKTSMASLHRSRVSHDLAPVEIPPLVIADPNDEWAEKLGHANFTIQPTPYLPSVCDQETCRQLLADWEKARSEYAIHRWTTESNYGTLSKIFKLTEQKWATIDAEWKDCSERASRHATVNGKMEPFTSTAEPAPVANIPHLDDPRIVQGDGIVGPMKVAPARTSPPPHAAPQISRRSSKRESLLRIFTPSSRSRGLSQSRVN